MGGVFPLSQRPIVVPLFGKEGSGEIFTGMYCSIMALWVGTDVDRRFIDFASVLAFILNEYVFA
jgi:hypothetical protein